MGRSARVAITNETAVEANLAPEHDAIYRYDKVPDARTYWQGCGFE
jgi:hypothetical protein